MNCVDLSMLSIVIRYRMKHDEVGLQLGCHQKYYISRCEEKRSILLTITVVGDDMRSTRERRELIDDITQLLYGVVERYKPVIEKPTLMVPCPLCPILHITLSDVSTGNTIFCSQSGDAPLPSGYYDCLILSRSCDPTPTVNDNVPKRIASISTASKIESKKYIASSIV